MKKVVDFLKTTMGSGLIVMLPALLFCLLIYEMLQLLVALASPIAVVLKEGGLEGVSNPILVALVLLAGASLLVGVAMRSDMGRRFGAWFERVTFQRFPIYAALKRLTRGFVDTEEGKTFLPALLKVDGGMQEVVYVVEASAEDVAAVMVPHAPTGFSGPVKIVDRGRLTMLDTNIGDLSRALSHWGVGTVTLAARKLKEMDNETT